MDVGEQRRPLAAGAAGIGAEAGLRMGARCGIYATLGAVMSCARVLENGAPFGMAMVACSGAGLTGVSALIGAAMGYLIGGGLEWGIRYIAASVLVYTIAFVFHELNISRSSFFMPSAAGFVMGLTGFLGSFTVNMRIPVAAELLLEIILAFAGTYFFREALSGGLHMSETAELRHSVAVIIMTACALMAFSRLRLFTYVSAGRVLAVLFVMTSAMKGGMLSGAAVGTVFGLAMDVCSGINPYYAMAYSFSGLLSGVFGRHGRLLFALSFMISGTLTAVCVWDEGLYISAFSEYFCAGLIFMLLPSGFLNRAAVILQCMDRGSGETCLRRFTASRVRSLSEAYSELYETVRQGVSEEYNDENIARIFDRAADEVCVRCKNKNRCWNADYVDTLSAMNDATRAMLANGSLNIRDIPGYFRDRCDNLTAFVAAVNGELRALSYRRRMRECLSENRSVAWGQYSDAARILGNVADELDSVNGAEPHAERRLSRYLQSLEIDAETAVYRDVGGRVHVNIESASLRPLLRDEGYLEKLSEITGVRLCCPHDAGEDCGSLRLLEAEPLAVSVGIAAMKKKGEKVSGDRGTYFKTDAGVLCVILADGMGSGDEAARDSIRVVGILEKFLRSGADPAVAMKILNSVLLLRSGETWGCAAVDLMSIDLFSGETCFYKYGAAPSYVTDGESIRRVKGETLAAGLAVGGGTAPDLVRMRLSPGNKAVIASDGVIADSEDEWLRELMLSGEEDMKALAGKVLKGAEKQYGINDDMTVITVRVEERG